MVLLFIPLGLLLFIITLAGRPLHASGTIPGTSPYWLQVGPARVSVGSGCCVLVTSLLLQITTMVLDVKAFSIPCPFTCIATGQCAGCLGIPVIHNFLSQETQRMDCALWLQYVCMYVCMFVCLCVCMSLCLYVCLPVCICVLSVCVSF